MPKRAGRTSRARRAKRAPAKAARRTYFFGAGRADGDAGQKNLLGGKGANLAEMTRLGVPVPAGFTISTDTCTEFYALGRRLPAGLDAEVRAQLAKIEKAMGGAFGSRERPLLVSVRSGARASMPGMMDTILNLGLNDETLQGLIEESGDRRFAYDTYRRFIHMYGDVVLGVKHELFESQLDLLKHARRAKLDTELGADDLASLVAKYKKVVEESTGQAFPDDPFAQLRGAIAAVFESWNTPRADTYRKLNHIPHEWGTAVNVQAMVYGNLGDDSATGVAFTRDPSTGDKRFFGEFLPRAQGEDVVAGIRTPQPISKRDRAAGEAPSLEELMPRCHRELVRTAKLLETHYADMQDLEFTIQRGRLWMLQTRSGKRTARAAVKIAVDMARERLIDRRTALERVNPESLDQLLHPTLDAAAAPPPIGSGLPASPGAAVGRIVFTAEDAEAAAEGGEDVVLVRRETSPEDIHGMHAAQGILTALGGMTSHAAVVARGMGKCCVAGCSALSIDFDRRRATLGGVELTERDVITLDGSTGNVFKGRVPTVEPELSRDFQTLMKWADAARRLRVRANADTPQDAEVAVRFGAEGVGLCRTEHMFFQAERILAVRRMILSETAEERAAALVPILPMQRDDFVGIFKAMAARPVTIRLLDPPLHEFLPHTGEEMSNLARDLGVAELELRRKVEALREFNPMLGHRGSRLAITYPEIYEIQVRAIVEAACVCADAGVRTHPEIMLPLVQGARELRVLRELVDSTAKTVMKERGKTVRYHVGTMIEVPRAAIVADRLAEVAEFFSFGTNDLTQMTLALSRDDSGRFLPTYVGRRLMDDDPFVTIDKGGVGALIRMGIANGRKTRRDLKVGICGEHGGEPRSIAFCHDAGLDYVSCSPYRVPIARLAAAQAAIARRGG
ncbi:MAG TPA: pyruvate, phosphate dikinase [Myxococcota bacterium]|nr:pyruvate, phosphate dikinase [Myxococcota bacterium]